VRRHPSIGGFLSEADLEVCSPGTDRKIRDGREYTIFRGRGVRILRRDGVWVRGRIEDTVDGEVTIVGGTATDQSRTVVPLADIKRAFLDEQQEVQT
jgi:ribosome maturation factor RimP